MLKTYKYRIYPNKNQEEYLINTFGCVRFIYNKMLADKIEYYKKTGKVLKNTYIKYKKEFEWLKETDQLALLNSQQNLEKDFTNFLKDKSVDFPKFKTKKSNYYSYITNNQNDNIYIQGKYIKISKLKSMIKIKYHREFIGSIKSCTISKDESDKYFISLLVDVEKEILPKVNKKIGVDVGLKEFAVCSDGYRVKIPEYLIKSERRLNRLEKELLRKQNGSKNRDKTMLKIKKLKTK